MVAEMPEVLLTIEYRHFYLVMHFGPYALAHDGIVSGNRR